MFNRTNLKIPLLNYFSLYWVIIDLHGLVGSPEIRSHQNENLNSYFLV